MLKYFLLVIIMAIQGRSGVCPLGTYGENCGKNCSTNCAPSSDNKVHCDQLTGRCSERCNRGWHGDQCYHRCSSNCLNHVCNVQTGTCIECTASYSGDYCETYKGCGPKECAPLVQETASTPLAAILVPVIIILTIIIIALIVLIIRLKRREGRMKRVGDEATKRLTSLECNGPAAEASPLQDQATDLHVACKEGKLEKVRDILYQSLEDIDKQAKDGMTPMMWAAKRGQREIQDLLMQKRANPQLTDIVGNNILHWACRGRNISVVKHIISLNAVDIDSKGRYGRTPLMYAARKGENKIFQLLVSKGGLPSHVDDDGNNILHLACWGGNVEMVYYILSHNAVDINGRGQLGSTPLTTAAYKGHGNIIDLLVIKGADLAVVDDAGGNVLHAACLGGHVDIVRYILKLDKVDINSCGQYHRTPLMMAARNGDKEIFDLLVKEGADAAPVDFDSNTMLHLASQGGNVDIVKAVISMMVVGINARNRHKETPTMMATRGSEVCDLLVSYGGLSE